MNLFLSANLHHADGLPVECIIADYSQEEQKAILGETAVRVYGL